MQKSGSRRYDTDALIEIADPETVAEALGLEMQRKGSRISILCPHPHHDDEHFGSCYLTKRGWHCFACNEHGDVISLVRYVMNYSFTEACKYLEDLYGISAKDNSRNAIKTLTLTDADLRMIGILPDNDGDGIEKTVALCAVESLDRDDLPKHRTARFRPFYITSRSLLDNTLPTGLYSIEERVSAQPLKGLRNNDEAAYRDLIAAKAKESAEEYRILSRCGLPWDLAAAAIQLADRCIEICLAHGGVITSPKKNVFGGFKGGGSI